MFWFSEGVCNQSLFFEWLINQDPSLIRGFPFGGNSHHHPFALSLMKAWEIINTPMQLFTCTITKKYIFWGFFNPDTIYGCMLEWVKGGGKHLQMLTETFFVNFLFYI